MATTAAKVCRICMVDCGDHPRVKDELGRYTCKACYDREEALNNAALRRAAGAPPARQLHEDNATADLRAAAMIEAKTEPLDLPDSKACPKCHGYLPETERLCMRCGFDRRRGCRVATRVECEKAKRTGLLAALMRLLGR